MDNEHVARLRKGPISTWNEWRLSSPQVPDLSRADLTDADLRGADLNDADLRGAALTNADLRGADLRGARLDEADLINADLTDADLTGAYLMGAYLSGANLTGADLTRAYLKGAYLSRAKLIHAKLTRAQLKYVDLRGAYLNDADLTLAQLVEADLREAILINANLYYAILRGADLAGADLTGANLTRALGADLTRSSASPAPGPVTEARTSAADLIGATYETLPIPPRIAEVTLTVNLPARQSPADLAAVLVGVASLVEASQRISSHLGPFNDPDTSSPGAVRTMSGDASGIEVEVRKLRYGSPFVVSLIENWEPFVVLAFGVPVARDVLKGLEQSAIINILLVLAVPSIREAFFEERREYYANKKRDRTTPAPTLEVPPMTLDEAAANLEQSVPDANKRLHVIETLPGLEALLSRGIVATEEPAASPPDVPEID